MPLLKRKPVLMHPSPSMSSIVQPVTDKPTHANGDASPGASAPSAPPDDSPKDSKDEEEQSEKLSTALNDPTIAAPAKKSHKDKVNGMVNGASTTQDTAAPGSTSLPSYRVKNVEVFYSPETGEIFSDYESYAQRQAFLDQPLFQCEVSGKSGSSYFEARENEQREARQSHSRFPKQSKKAVLESVQYQVEGKSETLADKIFERFVNRFFDDEKVFVDVQGDKYLARVVRTFPPKDLVLPEGASSPYHPYATDLDLEPEVVVERDDPMKYFYQVRLIEEGGDDEAQPSDTEEGKGEEFQGSVMEVQADKISRDRINFSRAMLKRFIRDCVSRDAAVFSPWIVKKPVASRYGSPTEMSDEIREKIDKIRSSEKTRKKRERDARSGITHSEGEEDSKPEKKKRKTKAEREKEKEERAEVKEEEKEEEEKKKKRGLKYPCEDLLLEFSQDRDATAGRIEVRPKPERSSPFGDDFDKFLFTWSFLNVMGKPSGLSPFTLDDYEQSSLHTDEYTAPAPISVEVHAASSNALMKDSEEGHEPVKPIVHWGLDYDNDMDYWTGTKGANVDTLRPVVEPLGESWTKRQLSYKDGRKGWESALVGCLWERADLDTLKDYLNYILHSTFEDKPAPTRPTWSTGPSTSSSHGSIPSKPERRYTSSDHKAKLNIISFSIDLVTQTANIRDFFEESTNAVTEVRKDLVDVRRDSRKNHAEQDALEPKKEKGEDGEDVKDEVPSSVAPSPNGHANGTATNTERDELEGSMMDDTSRANSPASEADRVRTAASRRRAMKEKASEREAEEAERQAALLRERAEAKSKRAESKHMSQEKKRSADAEEDLENRQRQLDYEFRRNNQVSRVKPIGVDRYGNRVWWSDGIGSAGLYDSSGKVTYGTGRLYSQGAEEFDVEHHRAAAESTEKQLSQRRAKEEGDNVLAPGEWAMYDTLEQSEGFKNWLNPRGYRDHHLLRFSNQWWPEITQGVQKRRAAAGLDGNEDEGHGGRRLRPSRRAAGDDVGEGYLGWKNRRAAGGRH